MTLINNYNLKSNMGILEKEIKNQIRTSKIQSILLQTIATAGLLSVALLAPNAVKIIGPLINKGGLRNKKRSINISRDRMIKKELIEYSKNGFLSLTPLGAKALERIKIKNFKITKPKKWDHKWRILIFDIKETHRTLRNQIRLTLNQIGFVKLQNSVWIYPYDCEDYITLLKTDFKIGKEILYIIADKIENEKPLLKYFGLSI
jgi:DNA-binding transcriptional regulator PaaX